MQRTVADGIEDTEQDQCRTGCYSSEDGEQGDQAQCFDCVEIFFICIITGRTSVIVIVGGVVTVAVVVVVVVVVDVFFVVVVFIIVVILVTVPRAPQLLTITLISMIMTLVIQQRKPRLIPHNMHRRDGNRKAYCR